MKQLLQIKLPLSLKAQNPKLNSIVLLLLFCSIWTSCTKKEPLSKTENSIDTITFKIDTITIVKGYLRNKKPDLFWNYYSSNGKIIKIESIELDLNTTKSRYYSHDGRLIYYEEILNDKIINRCNTENIDILNSSCGSILTKEFCSSCHSLRVNLIGKSFESIYDKDNLNYKNYKKENTHQKNIITKENFECIKNYIILNLKPIP